MSPNVPCTSTTGAGCCADGTQSQSFAPGGSTPGASGIHPDRIHR